MAKIHAAMELVAVCFCGSQERSPCITLSAAALVISLLEQLTTLLRQSLAIETCNLINGIWC